MGPLRQPTRARTAAPPRRRPHARELQAEILELATLDDADIERWRELADTALEPNPFFEPDFVLPLSEAVPTPAAGLLTVRSGRDWLAALPVRRAPSWKRIPLTGTVGWKSPYTYLGTPLLRRDHAERAARALLCEAVHGRRYLGLELLAGDGPVAQTLSGAARELNLAMTVLRSFERAALVRRPTNGYLELKPKHRRELRRLRDRLAEDLGAPLESRDEGSSDAAIDDFLRLEASGWKREHGTALASSAEHAQMFRRICRAFDARGRLQLLTLRGGQRAVAAKCNLLAGAGVFCFKIGFDEDFARFSPGIQLEVANVEHFHDREDLQWMDSCAEPGNQMINRLWPDRRSIEVTAVTGGGAGRATERVFRAAAHTRHLIKKGSE